ncbi:MAG: hypothetical protein HY390_07510 [Deltaproteobacteria bacterium]|nr:hypothetical protein [Deltaproteobacteria bacterium]
MAVLLKKGQVTLEYLAALMMAIVFIGFIIAQVDLPIRQWWDALARKVAAPCPSSQCVKEHTKSIIQEE